MKDQIETTSKEEVARQEPLAVIGEEQIVKATKTLNDYKQGKANLEQRIVNNEKWFKMRHWDDIKNKNDGSPRPASAWLLNSILNKHADAMDNFPEPSVLPREQSDEESATILSEVLPAILEQNEYESVYDECWWYKLKAGTAVKGIFWNNTKANGLGDIDIKKIDILNLFWEPGIVDIQDSKNIFNVELIDTEDIKTMYANVTGIENLSTGQDITVSEYVHDDTINTDDKSIVVDWYYKKHTESGDILHYCKYVNNIVIYASENDPQYAESGYYAHGQYPFVFDTMFMQEDSPCGFGYIDAMKDCQIAIDELDSDIQMNCKMSSRPRYLASEGSGINEDELADFSKVIIHCVNDPANAIAQLPISNINSFAVNYRDTKINELKETSGNRDFSQGGTQSGVTAASAIAALQEAGNKLSRDAIKSAYRSYTKECILVIELIRQFYTEQRTFRIVGEDGESKFVQFDNTGIAPQYQGNVMGVELGERMPIFDIKVSAQKQSPYATITQNELALQLFNLGMFNPQNADMARACIDMMSFEGKDKVLKTISQNQQLMLQNQQLQQQVLQLTDVVNATTGAGLDPTGQQQAQQPMQEEVQQ